MPLNSTDLKPIHIFVKTLTGKTIALDAFNFTTTTQLKGMVQDKEGILPEQQRLIHEGRELGDDRTLAYYGICSEDSIHLSLRLREGGYGPPPDWVKNEMNLAAGGIINQVIVHLPHHKDYSKTVPVTFNVQILNSSGFRAATGQSPPPTPVSAATYAAHGLPFFVLYEEPSIVAGQFAEVKSVGEIDGTQEGGLGSVVMVDAATGKVVGPQTNTTAKEEGEAIGILSTKATPSVLRFGWELEEEVKRQGNNVI